MNRIIFTFLLLQTPFLSFSQNDNDLYRYSKTTYYGTARFEAMGGSFGALGADLSSSQINPAGYGRYSSSNVGLSIFGGATANNARFQSVQTNTTQSQGGISNFAVVFTQDKSEESTGFLYSQIGIGYNQIEKFKNTFRYEGQQYASILDEFVGQAQGYFPEELNDYFAFSTELGYNTYAIDYDNVGQSFYSLLNNGDVYHNRTVETQGGIGEFFISYSTNYLNKLYLGANIGIRSIRYADYYSHTETLTDTTNTPLRSFNYEYEYITKGTGVNFKLGAIYLVSESLRFGLAAHSSTYAELRDDYKADMTSTFQDSIVTISDSRIPKGDYKYKIRNPEKVIASVAYVFGTKGCINVDVEYLNYKRARFKSTDDAAYAPYDYKYENDVAREVFQDAINVRVGGELVISQGFYIRAGFGYYGNAYKKELEVEVKPDIILSGGLGIKTKRFSLDLSYRNQRNTRNYYAFSNSVTQLKTNKGIVVISGSLNF